uniref:Transmembrane protein n=1 Tax=Heterosigma akashiwo TaxID=2829 RepID=A0A7S3URW3_HETAK
MMKFYLLAVCLIAALSCSTGFQFSHRPNSAVQIARPSFLTRNVNIPFQARAQQQAAHGMINAQPTRRKRDIAFKYAKAIVPAVAIALLTGSNPVYAATQTMYSPKGEVIHIRRTKDNHVSMAPVLLVFGLVTFACLWMDRQVEMRQVRRAVNERKTRVADRAKRFQEGTLEDDYDSIEFFSANQDNKFMGKMRQMKKMKFEKQKGSIKRKLDAAKNKNKKALGDKFDSLGGNDDM